MSPDDTWFLLSPFSTDSNPSLSLSLSVSIYFLHNSLSYTLFSLHSLSTFSLGRSHPLQVTCRIMWNFSLSLSLSVLFFFSSFFLFFHSVTLCRIHSLILSFQRHTRHPFHKIIPFHLSPSFICNNNFSILSSIHLLVQKEYQEDELYPWMTLSCFIQSCIKYIWKQIKNQSLSVTSYWMRESIHIFFSSFSCLFFLTSGFSMQRTLAIQGHRDRNLSLLNNWQD